MVRAVIILRAGALEKSAKKFSRKSLTVPKMSHSAHYLSLYIAEHTQLVLKNEEVSAANQNRARRTLILRQPIRIEHETPPQLRPRIRIEYYVTRELSARVEDPSRLLSARYSLS